MVKAIQIDTLIAPQALRCWATKEEMAGTISEMVKQALEQDISLYAITISAPDLEETGEYEIILWGDCL